MNISSLERRIEVLKLRAAGFTYAEIGSKSGITKERVRQILKGQMPLRKPSLKSKIMLSIRDVAYLLDIHRNTVRLWSNRGVLKSYRIGPRHDRRFRREDIDRFLEEGK